MPDEEYDRNGCYSGSAVEFEGALTLCNTGNVKFPDGAHRLAMSGDREC